MWMPAGCDAVSKVHIVNLDCDEDLGIWGYDDMISKDMKIWLYDDADDDDFEEDDDDDDDDIS